VTDDAKADPLAHIYPPISDHAGEWFVARLQHLDERGVAAAAAVITRTVGFGYVTMDWLLRNMENGTMQFLAAFPWGSMKALGGAVARLVDDDGYRQFIASMPEGTLPSTPPSLDRRKVGVLSVMAVAPSERRRGIGTQFAVRRTAWLKERCTEAYAVAWLHDQPGRGDSVLKTAGWEPVTVIRDYWKQASLRGDCHCHRCGSPCRCDGLLMRLDCTPAAEKRPCDVLADLGITLP
jgi:GNAT superfamily N-acetyltransferase